MSYTQHEWTTGETITAAKLNNIEEGIEEAAQSGGGVIPLVAVYFPNSTIGWQSIGLDFETALSMVQDGIPFIAYQLAYNQTAGAFVSYVMNQMVVYYDEENPNQIDLQITGGVGLIWTASGLSYYD